MILHSIFFFLSFLLGMSGMASQSQDIRETRKISSEVVQENLQYRVAFDMGSGNVKMQAAWVDPSQGKIVEMASSDTTLVPVRDAIDRDPDGIIPETIVQELASTLKKMQQKAESHGPVSAYSAGATEAYRVAPNGTDVLNTLSEELGISIYLLSQDEEAALGYDSLRAEGLLSNKQGAIVWENGGGSTQISRKVEGNLQSYLLSIGKVPMKNNLIQEIQGKNLNETETPNPISREQADRAIAWVKTQYQDAPDWLKGNKEVLGIGAMFPNVLAGLGKKTFTKQELGQLIETRIGKTDQEMNPEKDPTNTYLLSDLLYLYGTMEALEIEQISCPQKQGPGSTSGLLVDASKWTS